MNRAVRVKRANTRAWERFDNYIQGIDDETLMELLREGYLADIRGGHSATSVRAKMGPDFEWLLEDNWRETFRNMNMGEGHAG